MSWYICDLGLGPYFYHKDTYSIKYSCFYLLWGVRYKQLCEFHTFKNLTITSKLRVREIGMSFFNFNLFEPGNNNLDYPNTFRPSQKIRKMNVVG